MTIQPDILLHVQASSCKKPTTDDMETENSRNRFLTDVTIISKGSMKCEWIC